jgi:hypothetical protein
VRVEQVAIEWLERLFEDWSSGISLLAMWPGRGDERIGDGDTGGEVQSHIWSGARKCLLVSYLTGEGF